MRLALCNETLAVLPLDRQCAYAAALGYDGLEIAPYTLFEVPDAVSATEASRVRGIVEGAGLVVTGLHWLLVKPAGLSLTEADASIRARTLEVMTRLVGVCAELGGNVLVHGSPNQRQIAPGDTYAEARKRLAEALAAVAVIAELVRELAHPNLRTMIDCSAAGATETESVPDLIDRWLPTGLIAHIQINDPNRRAPGQGSMRFAPIAAALARNEYRGTVAVEPFDYVPDGAAAAAFAAGYWRGVREARE